MSKWKCSLSKYHALYSMDFHSACVANFTVLIDFTTLILKRYMCRSNHSFCWINISILITYCRFPCWFAWPSYQGNSDSMFCACMQNGDVFASKLNHHAECQLSMWTVFREGTDHMLKWERRWLPCQICFVSGKHKTFHCLFKSFVLCQPSW
jgi:hypothetical protein